VSGSGEGSEERLPAYPVTKKDLQVIDRNNSVWISPADKPVVMRLPKDSLRDVQNKAAPAISETYNLNPFEFAELVDREGNIWFGDTRGILRALARTSASMSFDVMTLEEIPFYNEDLDCPPDPPAVENMKKLIAESDGVLIATPEYNDGIPGVLKNALDWASRPAFQSGFKNKPVSIISSSLAHDLLAESPVRCATQSPARGRLTGGVRAQYKLREALIAMQAHLVMGPEVVIGGVHGKVDHSEYHDEGGLPFILQSLERLRAEILSRRAFGGNALMISSSNEEPS
jgi:chromate reductase, NAD(P)H dehydrogenase (quinone)